MLNTYLTPAGAKEWIATYGGTRNQQIAGFGHGIAHLYNYIEIWRGRGCNEAEVLEAIGVMKLAYFKLTGKAWVGEKDRHGLYSERWA